MRCRCRTSCMCSQHVHDRCCSIISMYNRINQLFLAGEGRVQPVRSQRAAIVAVVDGGSRGHHDGRRGRRRWKQTAEGEDGRGHDGISDGIAFTSLLRMSSKSDHSWRRKENFLGGF